LINEGYYETKSWILYGMELGQKEANIRQGEEQIV
jgi:hypothetical protein